MAEQLAFLGGEPLRKRDYPAWPQVKSEDESRLLSVLRSGKWGRHQGHCVAEFERAFGEYQGARFGIGVMNGSVALRIALQAAGVGDGDEVIVPPYTFYATAGAVLEVNAVPVFADIDPDTYCIAPLSILDVVTPRTRAVIPVHFAGQSVEMDSIQAIASDHGLVIIEDAAHAHGAEYKGRRLGSIGELGCFSFQSSKNLTSGEGGMIVCSEERFERTCRALHTCGRYPESAWYDHYQPGGNYRMTEFQAALLLVQLDRYENQFLRREANAAFLNRELTAIPGISPLQRGVGETRHAYHIYIFRYNSVEFGGLARDRFIEALAAEGIPCSGGYPHPLYRQPVFLERRFEPYGAQASRMDYTAVHLPASEQACREAVWIPHRVLLGDREDMIDIVQAIEKVRAGQKALLH
jgi:dTDP-4-amino-4,6-dideoxygalactose transaminase